MGRYGHGCGTQRVGFGAKGEPLLHFVFMRVGKLQKWSGTILRSPSQPFFASLSVRPKNLVTIGRNLVVMYSVVGFYKFTSQDCHQIASESPDEWLSFGL
ncbi:hypothetical protein H671_1g3399 [Cricetulus griseus]|nr:hypothetical protein H671_1g3399 [Cricetulus griseus]